MPGVPERGEAWRVDFGVTQKDCPALVISIPYADDDRALIGGTGFFDVLLPTIAMASV